VRNGNEGIGEPEPLKHDFAGYWSRRIDAEHRHVSLESSQVRNVPVPLRDVVQLVEGWGFSAPSDLIGVMGPRSGPRTAGRGPSRHLDRKSCVNTASTRGRSVLQKTL
jgi:hypothetical protein